MLRDDLRTQFGDLFAPRTVNGRTVDVQGTIATLTRELRPAIAAALAARRALLQSSEPVATRYAWPAWEERFEDPAGDEPWTCP